MKIFGYGSDLNPQPPHSADSESPHECFLCCSVYNQVREAQIVVQPALYNEIRVRKMKHFSAEEPPGSGNVVWKEDEIVVTETTQLSKPVYQNVQLPAEDFYTLHCGHGAGRACLGTIAKIHRDPMANSTIDDPGKTRATCPDPYCGAEFTLYDKLDTQGLLDTIVELFIKMYRFGVVEGCVKMELWDTVAPLFALLNRLDLCCFGTLSFTATLLHDFIHWVVDTPVEALLTIAGVAIVVSVVGLMTLGLVLE